jgi:hypothetical protein
MKKTPMSFQIQKMHLHLTSFLLMFLIPLDVLENPTTKNYHQLEQIQASFLVIDKTCNSQYLPADLRAMESAFAEGCKLKHSQNDCNSS